MAVQTEKKQVYFILLCLAFVGVSIGRAYQCIFWDLPIRSLLWNEGWMPSIVSGIFGLTWEEYLKHPNINSSIQGLVSSIGFLLVFSSGLALLRFGKRITKMSLHFSFGLLVFIAFLYHLEKFQTAGQFFEYSLQFMTPLILWYYVKNGVTKLWLALLKVAIALTFISHGLYALGFYPVPANFVAMTIQILPLSQEAAVSLLMVVGILDLIFSIGIFLKGWVFKISVWYCIIWGGLTTSARILANLDLTMFASTMHQWWFESVYRLPHFLIPLLLYLIWKTMQETPFIEKE